MLSKDAFWCELRCAVATTSREEYCGPPEPSLTLAKGSPGSCYPRRAKCYIIASSRCADPMQSFSTRLHGLLEVSLDWI